VGAKYTTGPLVMGVAAEHGDYQGSESYRYHPAARFGDRFWPGLHCGARIPMSMPNISTRPSQGDFNFITNAVGSGANNNIRSQGFLLGNVVNF
jgi:hypothetical protein